MLYLIASALAADPSYTVSFGQRQAHLVHIRAEIPASTHKSITELQMATWTPGSYLIREFSRHLENLKATAKDGSNLPVQKSAKNRWTVQSNGKPFTLHYDLYARAHNVRGNWVDSDLAVLNGAATFVVPVEHTGGYQVRVERPDGWAQTICSLPSKEDVFSAKNFDELVDSPILVGNPTLTTFVVADVEHILVDLPAAPGWDSKKAAEGLKKVVEQQIEFWGEVPYERYHFLNWIAEGRGGLEHANSTLLMSKRELTQSHTSLNAWLTLATHEHFHAWNGKRLHPAGLGPFDYENETYTPDLWIVEGITSYYDDLLMVRAGLMNRSALFTKLSKTLNQLQSTPGRNRQALSSASKDAWIKFYRPDENSSNSSVSYYLKGSVIAWLLDARIRALTKGDRSLDDVMLLARSRFRDRGYQPEEFRALIDEVAGTSLQEDLTRWLDTTEELDLRQPLEYFGFEILSATSPPDPWLGIEISKHNTVRNVRRDGPSARIGIAVDDELIAIDGWRLDHNLSTILKHFKPGDTVNLLISHQGIIRELPLVLGSEPHPIHLGIEASTHQQEKHRDAWLSGK